MFLVKDKTGQEIFLKDKVRYEGVVDSMGLLDQVDGYVIALLTEDMVQVQPLGGGVPVPVPGCEVLVMDSLTQRVANLSSHEELQAILKEAEDRHLVAVEASKKPRAKKDKGATKAKVVEETAAVEI